MKKYLLIILCFLPMIAYADVAIIKYDKEGNVVWQTKHAIGDNYNLFAENNILLLSNYILTWGDNFLLKLNKQGLAQWIVNDNARYATADSNGNIYAIIEDYSLICFSSNGNIIWKKEFIDEYISNIFVTDKNEIFVATLCGNPPKSTVLYKYNNDGSFLWERSFSIDSKTAIGIDKIFCNQNDSIYLICSYDTINSYPYNENTYPYPGKKLFINLDINGEIMWEYYDETCFGSNQEFGINGTLYTVCSDYNYNGQADRLMKINTDGDLEWEFSFDDYKIEHFGINQSENIVAIDGALNKNLFIIDQSGQAILSGGLLENTSEYRFYGTLLDSANNVIIFGCKIDGQGVCRENAIFKYNEEGKSLWLYQNDIGTMAIDAAVDEDDNIYVVGDVEDKDEEEEDSGCGCGG